MLYATHDINKQSKLKIKWTVDSPIHDKTNTLTV